MNTSLIIWKETAEMKDWKNGQSVGSRALKTTAQTTWRQLEQQQHLVGGKCKIGYFSFGAGRVLSLLTSIAGLPECH